MEFDTTRPIYIQIGNKIRADVLSGRQKPGEKLPSLRELSVIYGVSNLTIHRVFQYLEQEQIIVIKKGVGCFVNPELNLKIRGEMLNSEIQKFIERMKSCGLSREDSLRLIQEEWKEEEYE